MQRPTDRRSCSPSLPPQVYVANGTNVARNRPTYQTSVHGGAQYGAFAAVDGSRATLQHTGINTPCEWRRRLHTCCVLSGCIGALVAVSRSLVLAVLVLVALAVVVQQQQQQQHRGKVEDLVQQAGGHVPQAPAHYHPGCQPRRSPPPHHHHHHHHHQLC